MPVFLRLPPLYGHASCSKFARGIATQQITPRIARIAVPGPRQSTNAFLVGPPEPPSGPSEASETAGFALIDTGAYTRDAVPPLLGAVKDVLDRRRAKLAAILVTHGHAGHSGGLEAVRKEFPNALVHRGVKVGKDSVLKDNQVLDLGAKIRCLATPGHTEESFSFLVEDDRALCTGDAVFSIGFPSPFPESADPLKLSAFARLSSPAYHASLSKMLAQFPYFILSGHGEPIYPNESPPTILERALEAQEALGRYVVAVIKSKGFGQLVPTKAVLDGVMGKIGGSKDPERVKRIAGNVKVHLLDLADRGSLVRHPPAAQDPSKVFGPGGLNMVQVMGLIKDREAKDREHGKAAPEGVKQGPKDEGKSSKGPSDSEIEASTWEVIS